MKLRKRFLFSLLLVVLISVIITNYEIKLRENDKKELSKGNISLTKKALEIAADTQNSVSLKACSGPGTTAEITDVLAGKTYYSDNKRKSGTIPNKTSTTGSLNESSATGFQQTFIKKYNADGINGSFDFVLPHGYYGPGSVYKFNVANLKPENIKHGVTISDGTHSITGTFTSDANAIPTAILAGKTAYVQGQLVTGTIPSKTAETYYPSRDDQIISLGQYLAGPQTIKGYKTTNLKPEYLVSGKRANIGIVEESTKLESVEGTYPVGNSIFDFATLVKETGEGEWLAFKDNSMTYEPFDAGRFETGTIDVDYDGLYIVSMLYSVRPSGNCCKYTNTTGTVETYLPRIDSIDPPADELLIAPGTYLIDFNGKHTINVQTRYSGGGMISNGNYWIYKVNAPE